MPVGSGCSGVSIGGYDRVSGDERLVAGHRAGRSKQSPTWGGQERVKGERGFTLSGPQIANLARYYPDGADLAVRGEFTHAQKPDGTRGCLIGGELDSEPGMAGSIGMTRRTFLSLPVDRAVQSQKRNAMPGEGMEPDRKDPKDDPNPTRAPTKARCEEDGAFGGGSHVGR